MSGAGALAVIILCACSTPVGPRGEDRNRVAQLHLITVPVALDLDAHPGVDGVAVKVYANNARDPKAIRLRDGTLEVIMFNGTFTGRTSPPPVLRTFSYTVPELRLGEFNSKIGYGYDFSLRWGTNRPTQRLMSVAARYTAPDGQVVTSRPSSVTVLDK
ncbi:MAG TPA: hypothetical protein VF773_08435 [Verrucomicrobiae bacterium]